MSKTNSSVSLRMSIYTALFTALIIVGSYISIPLIGGVPITLADFFVMLTGFFLGAKYGVLSVVIYIVLGALGLPVYAGGTSGIAILFGPTGGFFFGYIAAAGAIGFISSIGKYSLFKNAIALIVAEILLFSFGLVWLKIRLDLSWGATFAVGFTPFIPGILIKTTASFIISKIAVPKFRAKIANIKKQYEEYSEITK